jgi:hypothetical protein
LLQVNAGRKESQGVTSETVAVLKQEGRFAFGTGFLMLASRLLKKQER